MPQAEAKISYLTQDHLGSPRIITDSTGQIIARKDFGAFGDETFTVQRTETLGYKPENIRQDYTGYQKDDESGFEFAQARYYNSKHGRFTSVDPLTASANVKDPQTFNRYTYAMNSPYKFTDPLGLISQNTGANGGRAWCSTCQAMDNDNGDFAEEVTVTQQHESDHHAEASPPLPAAEQNTDLTDAEIRAKYPVFTNPNEQAQVTQAINDAGNIVDPRGLTNIVPSILIGNFRRSGDSTTPQQAIASLDATTGVNITRDANGDVTNLTMQNVFDGRTSTLPIDHDRNPQTPSITVAEFFRTTPTVNAVTTSDGLVFLGQGFFNQNNEGRAKTMIHEGVVHKGFGRQDTDFGTTQQIGSREINRRIDNAYRWYHPSTAPQPIVTTDATPISTQILPRTP